MGKCAITPFVKTFWSKPFLRYKETASFKRSRNGYRFEHERKTRALHSLNEGIEMKDKKCFGGFFVMIKNDCFL